MIKKYKEKTIYEGIQFDGNNQDEVAAFLHQDIMVEWVEKFNMGMCFRKKLEGKIFIKIGDNVL